MELADALMMRAGTAAGVALNRLRAVPASHLVAVLLEAAGAELWFVSDAGGVRAAAGAVDPGEPLERALALGQRVPVPGVQLDDAVGSPRRGRAVVLDGDRVVGVLVPPRPVGRGPDRPPIDPPSPAGPRGVPPSTTLRGRPMPLDQGFTGAIRGEVDMVGSGGLSMPGDDGPGGRMPHGGVPRGRGPGDAGPDDAGPDDDGPDDDGPDDDGPGDGSGGPGEPGRDRAEAGSDGAGRFAAHPALGAPAQVTAGSPFELTVGFDPVPDAGTAALPVLLVGVPDRVEFVVQVLGSGFGFPEGVRRTLTVPRDDPGAATVTIPVVAERTSTTVTRVLEVSYSYRGNPVGRAWREVRVATEPAATAAPPRAGGSGIADPVTPAPHLSVQLHARPGTGELEWIFDSRYPDLPFPTGKVTTTLAQQDARAFSEELMAVLPGHEGGSLLDETVTGIGRTVADVLPQEFWLLLSDAWQRAADAGEIPTLLLVTDEPYVPWELAWVEDHRLAVDGLLPAGVEGGVLGALWRIGRWVPPTSRSLRGGDRPPMPPVTTMPVPTIAVVAGDYRSESGQRPLPEAMAEGDEIAIRYDGLRLAATEAEVQLLLDDGLVKDGAAYRPAAVHFACHGEVDPDHIGWSGIVLSDTDRRLNPLVIRGARLSGSTRPFVFLNACQVGTAGSILSLYGGLAGSFLAGGCRGFVAPLWNVDDKAAREVATSFYEQALDTGVPVSEVLRAVRAGFATDGTATTSTRLAYVFYGHPALVLTRAGGEGTAR